jgi:hypothetical protein
MIDEALNLAETQCDFLLVVAAPTSESVEYLIDVIDGVPDNVPVGVVRTTPDSMRSRSAEEQAAAKEAYAKIESLCGSEINANVTGPSAGGWDIELFSFSLRSKSKEVRELWKFAVGASLDPACFNPNTSQRRSSKRWTAIKQTTFTLLSVATLTAGASALGYYTLPNFRKFIDSVFSTKKSSSK